MRAESGFIDREIGMVDAFSDEDNEKPVCLQFQEMSGSPENQKFARKMVYRTLSVNEAEQFWSLMNQLDYYMARVI